MSVPEALFYVGIDWATETHAVCVLTAAGRIKTQFMIEHTAAGFADLLRRLVRLTVDPADVPVGIERPDGRLVDALLEPGFSVVPVSPNAIKTWRDGEVLSDAKMPVTPQSLPSMCGSEHIICVRPPRIPARPGRCAPRSEAVTTWSRCGSPRRISCPHCSTCIGPARKSSSPTWNRRLHWRSWPAIRPTFPRSSSARDDFKPSSPGTSIPAAVPALNYWSCCGPPRPGLPTR